MTLASSGAVPPDDQTVEVRPAGDKGLGVFARRDFSPGELVLQFERGRIVRTDEVDALSDWERQHLGELTADTCQVLPPPRCYVNHACEPNAVSTSTELRARLAIRAGDEITIDYRLNALDDWELRCECPAFSGPHMVIGSFLTLPTERQEAYLPDAPAFVRDAYRRHRAGG